MPEPAVIAEMNNTAAQQQRIKTEGQRKLADDARRQAEEPEHKRTMRTECR